MLNYEKNSIYTTDEAAYKLKVRRAWVSMYALDHGWAKLSGRYLLTYAQIEEMRRAIDRRVRVGYRDPRLAL
jgi:hypothetical protein